jgi:radical SAM superfamily enzyme YgiQ (UPF0313 family)
MVSRALLINPSIYDFAAYSFWSSPLGLLYIGGILRANDMEVNLIDCMQIVERKRKVDGRAPFVKEKVESPPALKHIRKRFKRYGISRDALIRKLGESKEPDIILITSIMTYWYLGVKEALEAARHVFPSSKIIIGGIYPSLCSAHADRTLREADLIIKNSEIEKFYGFVENVFDKKLTYKPSLYDLDHIPYPCYDLYKTIPFVPLLTSFGCMYRCAYCATPYMHPGIVRRSPGSVIEEVRHWHELGVSRYVLYDDNFLYKNEVYAKPLLKKICSLPFQIDIYNPNAMNGALIDDELAHLLRGAGFREIRIGLESADPVVQKSTGSKISLKHFEKSVTALIDGGFKNNEIVAYILAGLPNQRWEEVKQSIDYVLGIGIQPYIAEYTPIPHTRLFDEYGQCARFPIWEDPIYQNNALFPFAWEGFSEKDLEYLKLYARDKRFPEHTNKE